MLKFTPSVRRQLRLVPIAVAAFINTGCIEIGIDTSQFDRAIKEVREFRLGLERESSNWRAHLSKMQGQLRTDVESSIGALEFDVLEGAMCYTEFLEHKVVNYLKAVEYALMRKRLEYRLHGEKALDGTVDSVIKEIVLARANLDPHVCKLPRSLDVSYTNSYGEAPRFAVATKPAESSRIAGFAFQKEGTVVYIEAIGANAHRRLLGTSEGASPVLTINSNYAAELRLDKIAPRLQEGDNTLVVKCDGKDLAKIGLNWGNRPGLPVPESPWPKENINPVYKTIDRQTVVVKNMGESKITFSERIDGQSRVIVIAPRGTVDFSTPPGGLFNDGSKIDGGSMVLIVANSVTFKGKVDNDHSRVLVILTSNGPAQRGMSFFDIIGDKSRAYWCTDRGEPGTLQPPRNKPQNLERVPFDRMMQLIGELGFVGQGLLNDADLKYLRWYAENGGK